MRPDRRRRNRRNVEKSVPAGTSESSNEEKNVKKYEGIETDKTVQNCDKPDQTKPITNEEPENKEQVESQPVPNLRRETDALKETKKYSKRQIFSNWEEYDKPILPEENDEELYDDFGSLIQRNFSGDEHFKFKCERQWESESCSFNQNLFSLNLEQLSAGLECIPYYKRLDLPKCLFSEDELKRMDKIAKGNEKVYEILLKGQADNLKNNIVSLLVKKKDDSNDNVVTNSNESSNSQNPEVEFKEELLMNSDNIVSSDSADWQFSKITTNEIEADEIMFDMKYMSFSQGNRKRETEIQVKENKGIVKGSKEDVNKHRESNEIGSLVTLGKEDRTEREEMQFNVDHEDEGSKSKDKETEWFTKNISKEESASHTPNKKIISQDIPVKLKINESDNEQIDALDTKKAVPLSVPKENEPKKNKSSKVQDIDISCKSKSSKTNSTSKVKSHGEEEEILDSLLSLKKPVISSFDSDKKKSEMEENEAENLITDVSSIVIHEKKENLEDWLDSMLDD